MGGFFYSIQPWNSILARIPAVFWAGGKHGDVWLPNLPQGFATPGALSGNNTGGGMSIAVGDPAFLIKDAKQMGLYFQDDWKFSLLRLTVNLGIRWETRTSICRRFKDYRQPHLPGTAGISHQLQVPAGSISGS